MVFLSIWSSRCKETNIEASNVRAERALSNCGCRSESELTSTKCHLVGFLLISKNIKPTVERYFSSVHQNWVRSVTNTNGLSYNGKLRNIPSRSWGSNS